MDFNKELAVLIAPCIRMIATKNGLGIVAFYNNEKIASYIKNEKDFKNLNFYYKNETLFIAKTELETIYVTLQKNISAYINENGQSPKLICIQNVGVYCIGNTKAITNAIYDAFLLAANNQEPTKTLKSIIENDNETPNFRLKDKITIITGSAQGFGLGIARAMASEGAYIVVADLNEEGAKNVALDISNQYGEDYALGVGVDVSNEQDVTDMVYNTVLCYGGLDVFVNNAGIVKAGSIEEMQLSAFELVTKVNYSAYFLCVKLASRIMKIQNRFSKDKTFDIIQINSKSGLEGSKKNFAYAGSKFGGIGLTESFALELVEFNIKVNSICPGNFLNGPLWTDPEKGLFMQYLKAGKVPGAKTIDDVKKFYEAKVPLGRGCETIDVARAIYYIIEQTYETGQAIPVTGGQVMLK